MRGGGGGVGGAFPQSHSKATKACPPTHPSSPPRARWTGHTTSPFTPTGTLSALIRPLESQPCATAGVTAGCLGPCALQMPHSLVHGPAHTLAIVCLPRPNRRLRRLPGLRHEVQRRSARLRWTRRRLDPTRVAVRRRLYVRPPGLQDGVHENRGVDGLPVEGLVMLSFGP